MMNTLVRLSFVLFFIVSMNSQGITGKWQTFSSDTGEVKSIVEVFEHEGKIHGRIFRLMEADERDNLCTECEGEDKDKPIEGLVLMKDFVKEDNMYVDGNITNPDDGKVYRSKIWLDEDDINTLHVRGYIGFFYKTMEWKRLVE